MKIISRFHDYYDTVLSHGHDETCTFYRNSKQTGASDLNPPLDFLIPYLSESGYPWSTFTSSMEKSGTCYFFRAFLVLFCGKLYHGIGIDKYHQEKKIGNTLYFYSHEELESYCEEHKLVYECHQLWKSGHDETMKKIKRWLKTQGSNKYFEQLVDEGISIAVFYGGGRGIMRMNHDPNTFNCKALLDLLHHKPSYVLWNKKVWYVDIDFSVLALDTENIRQMDEIFPANINQSEHASNQQLAKIASLTGHGFDNSFKKRFYSQYSINLTYQLDINCSLKSFAFYKVFDAYAAFQELEMYLSGILSRNENAMISLDDKLLIQKKGFDSYSFKKRSLLP